MISNIDELLQQHFGLATTCVSQLPSPNQLHVRITIETGQFNREHLFDKWDYLCSRLHPSLMGGSWDCEHSQVDGYDHFDFFLEWKPVKQDWLSKWRLAQSNR